MLRSKYWKLAAGALCAATAIGLAPLTAHAYALGYDGSSFWDHFNQDGHEGYTYSIIGDQLHYACESCGEASEDYIELQVDPQASAIACTGQLSGITLNQYGIDEAMAQLNLSHMQDFLYWQGSGETVWNNHKEVPNVPGTYTVCICPGDERNDLLGTPHTVTVYTHQTSGQTYTKADCPTTAVASGDCLKIACAGCGYVYENSPTISIRMNSDNIIGLEAGETSCWEIVKSDNWSSFFADGYEPELVLVYEGADATKYSISTEFPTTPGTYTVSLTTKAAYETGKKAAINKVRTTKLKFYVKNHRYTYTLSGFGITAKCISCSSQASVSIDTEYVYDQARTYGTYSASKQVYVSTADYDLVSENGWSSAPDILPYTVLYNGTHTVSSTETVAYSKVFEELKPTTTGNYTAQLAVLRDENDPDSAIVTSAARPFYLSDINVRKCTLREYGTNEISQFTQPQLADGYYQVGTLSELLWCIYNKNTDANISLTNDIVVNPIRVSKNGTITSASYSLYNWKGFGASSAYTGTIRGNGHTIYGIYHPNASSSCSQCAGFIVHGANCSVYDLTVENSFIKEGNAGSVLGWYEATKDIRSTVSNCRSVNCCISSNSDSGTYTDPGGTAGGIIGYLQVFENITLNAFRLENCSSDSIVKNSFNAGGIVGCMNFEAKVIVTDCVNCGNIQSSVSAGGIFGTINLSSKPQNVTITNCINVGQIDGDKFSGGIVGRFIDSTNYNVTGYDPDSPAVWRKVLIDSCISQGHTSDTATHSAGIIGYYNNLIVYLKDNSYSNAGCACEAGTKVTGQYNPESRTYEIPNSQGTTYACQKYGHKISSHWSGVSLATCTTDGSMSHVCKLCGQVMDTQVLSAHGHFYEDGVCIYCGEAEAAEDTALEPDEESDDLESDVTEGSDPDSNDLEGTVTSSSGTKTVLIVAGSIAAVLAAGAGTYAALRKRKKKKE